jgi:hypothetical protein
MEKDKIFAILNDWNAWNKPLPATFSRPLYEQGIVRKAKSGEVIVIKGVRRSGKSTLLTNEIKRLQAAGMPAKNILFVNLEDQRFSLFEPLTLLEKIKETWLEYVQPQGATVIMLDEVQNIPQWEKWVLKEYETGSSKLYVTGSNSQLLGVEFGTALTGRYLDVEVYPLSFKEFLLFHGVEIHSRADFIQQRLKVNQLFRTYVAFGGFPKIALTDDELLAKETLKVYFDSILLRDIVSRHKLNNFAVLQELSLFLLSNNATLNAYNKLKNTFNVSFEIIREYVEFLQGAYLIFTLNKFDYSYKKQVANPKKFYAVDTGLSNNVSFSVSAKISQNLENIVFLELKRRRKAAYYYKTANNLEVDFLVEQDDCYELIQVCATLQDPATRQRELRVFAVAGKELHKPIKPLVLTLDDSETVVQDGLEVKVRNVLEWLCLF